MADDFDPDSLQTAPPPAAASMKVRPERKPLSRDETAKLVRKYNPDITEAAVQGEVDNIFRESDGRADVPGDYKDGKATSGGLYQYHNTRLTGVKNYAKEHGTDWTDPDIQIQYARLEKERDYPGLLKLQQSTSDRNQAEDAFKRIFERPASVLWQNDAKGEPVLGNDKFRFSDYAMKEHAGRPDTDLHLMSPQEYLDLSPKLEAKPFESPSGRSLMASFEKGEPIEAVPTIDIKMAGPTATVTDQDGRHRALLAQQQGIEAIPVAVRRTGEGQPKEIVGMDGVPQAFDYPKASEYQGVPSQAAPKPSVSLFGQANAAEPTRNAAGEPTDTNPFAQWATPTPATPAQSDNPFAQWAKPADGQQQAQPGPPEPELADPNASEFAMLKGAAKGFGTTVFAGQELLGKGMQAVGIPGGETLTNDARARMAAETRNIAPTEAAHPTATGVGEFLGGMLMPGGAGAKIGGNALRAATMGGVAGALQPGGQDFWTDKALQTGVGAATGLVGNAMITKVADMIAPPVLPLYHFVQRVTGKEVGASPAALAVLKRLEMDARAGGPTAQDMLDLANATPEKALTIADLGGPEIMGLTGRVARAPGPGRAAITNFLNERDIGAGERLAGDVNKEIASGSSYYAATTLRRSRAAAAKPAYEAAYAHYPINPDEMAETGAIGSMMARPSFRQGMANARKIAAEEGVGMNTLGIDLDAQGEPRFVGVPTWRTLDYVKRGMDDVVEKFRDPTTGRLVLDTYGHAAQDTRSAYRNTLRGLNKEYGAALDAYSGPSTSLSALQAGEDFLSQRPEEIAQRLSEFGPGDREFYKLGAADTLRTRLEKKATSADEAKALINTQYMRRQLRPLFESDTAYDRFMASVQAEARMFGTRFNALGGSQTAARRAEDTSPDLMAMVHAARGLYQAKTGNPILAGANALRALSSLRDKEQPALMAEIADILKTPVAQGAVGDRLRDFKTFMSALPMTRKHMLGNALSDLTRGAGPGGGLALGSAAAGVVPTGTPGQQ